MASSKTEFNGILFKAKLAVEQVCISYVTRGRIMVARLRSLSHLNLSSTSCSFPVEAETFGNLNNVVASANLR